jgi:hypothetical protein
MKAPLTMRVWFALLGALLWAGIFLTGFSAVNWLLFFPAAGLTLASTIGFCPSQIAIGKLFGGQKKK